MVKVLTKKESRWPVLAVLKMQDLACKLSRTWLVNCQGLLTAATSARIVSALTKLRVKCNNITSLAGHKRE